MPKTHANRTRHLEIKALCGSTGAYKYTNSHVIPHKIKREKKTRPKNAVLEEKSAASIRRHPEPVRGACPAKDVPLFIILSDNDPFFPQVISLRRLFSPLQTNCPPNKTSFASLRLTTYLAFTRPPLRSVGPGLSRNPGIPERALPA